MNEVKVGKLPVKTTQRTCDFISKLGKKKTIGGKNMVAFGSTVQKFHWLFFSWKTVSRFQRKEIKFYI